MAASLFSWTVPFLGIVHMSCHVCACIATVSTEEWKRTHTLCCESALQRLVLFTRHLQSDSAAHPQRPCQRHWGLPNYIKWTTSAYWSLSVSTTWLLEPHLWVLVLRVWWAASSSSLFGFICSNGFSMLFSSQIYWFFGSFYINSQNSFPTSDQDSNPLVFFFFWSVYGFSLFF